MAKVICVWNAKGGVGKTSVILSLASCLQQAKKSVLLVDMDSQSSLSKQLGFDNNRIKDEDIFTIKDLYREEDIQAKDLIYKINDNLSIIPNTNKLNEAIYKVDLEDQIYKPKKVLKKYFDSLQESTMVLVDSIGANNTLSRASLYLSDFVIIPVLCSKITLEEIETTFSTIKKVVGYNEKKPKILGLLLNMCKETSGISKGTKEYLKEIAKENNTFVYDKAIRFSQAIPESEFSGMDINTYLGNFDYREVKFKVISKKDMERFKKLKALEKAKEICSRIAIPKKITSGLLLPSEAYNFKMKYRTMDSNLEIDDNKLNIDKCPYGKYESKLFIDIIDINNITFTFELTIKIVKDNVGYDYIRFAEELLEKIGE